MLIRSTYNLTFNFQLNFHLSIDNNIVSHVTSNKRLGVLLDEKLKFETHIEYICKKACACIEALRKIKPFVML